MQIISNMALITINETLLVQLISFLIFVFIINRIMFRPLQGIMSERDNYIQKVHTDITDANNELDKLAIQLKESEAAAKNEAFKFREKQEELANNQAADIFASARQEITTIKERSETQITAQIAEARKSLKKESEALALSIMEKILDRRLSL